MTGPCLSDPNVTPMLPLLFTPAPRVPLLSLELMNTLTSGPLHWLLSLHGILCVQTATLFFPPLAQGPLHESPPCPSYDFWNVLPLALLLSNLLHNVLPVLPTPHREGTIGLCVTDVSQCL